MLKIFHIDCGRKYFSKNELSHLINHMGKNNYDMIEMAIGNGGMRFLIDDMEIETSSKKYSSEAVKAAINAGNKAFCDCGTNELTESEMKELVETAKKNNIKILPLINSPGHMEAIVVAMETLGIEGVRYKDSSSTLDFACNEAAVFLKKFLGKYIEWFSAQGSTFFNMGCDEYANDVLSSGFESLCNPENFLYDRFVSYVNEIADIVTANNMTPVMFNDGMYYAENTKGGKFNSEIVCSYWSEGWPGYTPAKARFIEAQGHKILNTANNWYYVLGRRDGMNVMFTDNDAVAGIKQVGKDEILGGAEEKTIGAMMCLWCDEPTVPYSEEEVGIVEKLLELF